MSLTLVCADASGISSGVYMETCLAAKRKVFSTQVCNNLEPFITTEQQCFLPMKLLMLEQDSPYSEEHCPDCSWRSEGGGHSFPCHTQLGVSQRVIYPRQTWSGKDNGLGGVLAQSTLGAEVSLPADLRSIVMLSLNLSGQSQFISSPPTVRLEFGCIFMSSQTRAPSVLHPGPGVLLPTIQSLHD